jgi:hypothetical protein
MKAGCVLCEAGTEFVYFVQMRPVCAPGPVHMGFVVGQNGTGSGFFSSTFVWPCSEHSVSDLYSCSLSKLLD